MPDSGLPGDTGGWDVSGELWGAAGLQPGEERTRGCARRNVRVAGIRGEVRCSAGHYAGRVRTGGLSLLRRTRARLVFNTHLLSMTWVWELGKTRELKRSGVWQPCRFRLRLLPRKYYELSCCRHYREAANVMLVSFRKRYAGVERQKINPSMWGSEGVLTQPGVSTPEIV